MDSERRILSPAKRSRRCALTLIAGSALMVIAFVGSNNDRFTVRAHVPAVTAPDTAPVATATDRQPSVPVQVSMARSIAP